MTRLERHIDNFKKLIFKLFICLWDSLGLLKSIRIYLFRDISKPGVFRGYHSFWFACKYADKRTKKWKSKWDQSGKRQAVNPFGNTELIVCSAMELKYYNKKKLFKRRINPRKSIRKAYYTTTI
jgi:hypothetical protein